MRNLFILVLLIWSIEGEGEQFKQVRYVQGCKKCAFYFGDDLQSI